MTDDDTYFSDRLDSLVEKEVSAASIPLNTPDGALLFRSDIADSIAFPTGTAKVSLSSLTDAAGERGVYLSGVFYVNTFKIEDSLLRSVELSKNAAIIAEVLNAGFNDVVIIAPHITEAHIDEVIRFTENIRKKRSK